LPSVALVNGQLESQVGSNVEPGYAAQGPTNFIDWSDLSVANSPAMPFRWMDTNAAALPMQFCRIKAAALQSDDISVVTSHFQKRQSNHDHPDSPRLQAHPELL
jgi:hypothetical protein